MKLYFRTLLSLTFFLLALQFPESQQNALFSSIQASVDQSDDPIHPIPVNDTRLVAAVKWATDSGKLYTPDQYQSYNITKASERTVKKDSFSIFYFGVYFHLKKEFGHFAYCEATIEARAPNNYKMPLCECGGT